MTHKPLFLLLFLFLIYNAFSQENYPRVLTITENKSYYVNPYFYIIEDTTNKLSFEQIKHSEQFIEIDNHTLDLQNSYWLKMSVTNTLYKSNNWIFEIRSAPEIDVYIETPNDQYEHKQIGFLLHHSKLEYFTSFYNSSRSNVYFPYINDTINIYIHIKAGHLSNYYPFSNFYPQEFIIKYKEKRNFSQGIFMGIMFIMIVYHLLIYISVREKSYIYYSLYMLFMIAGFLVPFGYFWHFMVGPNYKIGVYLIYFFP